MCHSFTVDEGLGVFKSGHYICLDRIVCISRNSALKALLIIMSREFSFSYQLSVLVFLLLFCLYSKYSCFLKRSDKNKEFINSLLLGLSHI